MSIQRHPVFPYDYSQDTVLWRYMPLTKFLWLVSFGELYFCRQDKFTDKREYLVTDRDVEYLRITKEQTNDVVIRDRKTIFVNCWCMSDHELSLMWNGYSSEESGVAIKTTVGHLMKSDTSNHTIYGVKVQYIDDAKEAVHKPGERINFLRFITTKRKLFSQEQEFRLVYHYTENYPSTLDQFTLPVDLNELIQEVHLSPNMPEYIKDIVRDVIKKADLKCKVVESELLDYGNGIGIE